MFKDRIEAGNLLAQKLVKFRKTDSIVFGITRGGAVIAKQVALKLKLPLDVIIVKKIGSLHDPELAIGAVCQDGTVVKDPDMIARLNISQEYFDNKIKEKKQEIRRLLSKLDKIAGRLIESKTAIVCDDGIATGITANAVIKYLKNNGVGKIILAVPIISYDIMIKLKSSVDSVIALTAPQSFSSVGQFYQNFSQITDDDVKSLLT